VAADPTKVSGPTIHLDGCGLAVRKIVQDTAGQRIGELLAAGETDRDRLVAAGRQALLAIVPPAVASTPAGQRRMASLAAMVSRVVVAPLVTTPPTLDGKPDEALWQWTDQHPWFNWQSTVADDTTTTRFAMAHDGRYLYVALRCLQPGLASQQRCPDKYGAPAFQFPSVELFLNADQPGVARDQLAFYQAIPAWGGGFMECGGGALGDQPKAMAGYAMSDGPDEWCAELKIDLQVLGLTPADHRYLRLNLVRNLGAGGFTGRTWFPSPSAHRDPASRGWLVLGK
jgi:hypothetical protein